MDRLPTGGCNHRDRYIECGCQKFWVRRTRRKPRARKSQEQPTSSRDRSAATDEDEPAEEEEHDDNGEECLCGHHACFHTLEAKPASNYDASSFSGRQLSLHASTHEPLPRTTMTALSAISGTTTELDPTSSTASASSTPSTFIKPHIFPHPAQQAIAGRLEHGSTIAPSGSIEVPLILQTILERLPSGDGREVVTVLEGLKQQVNKIEGTVSSVREKVEALDDRVAAVQEHTGVLTDRVDIIENLGDDIETRADLAEQTALSTEDKMLSFEGKIDSKIEDRIAQHQELLRNQKRKRRFQRSADGDGASSHHHTDKRAEKRPRDASYDSATHQSPAMVGAHQVTTTTSFTTSTSTSFCYSSPSTANRGDEKTTQKLISQMEALHSKVDLLQSKVVPAVESVEGRLKELEQCAPPSLSRPWDIVVILLPPYPLRGVWFGPDDSLPSTQYEGISSDEQSCVRSRTPYLALDGSYRPRSFSSQHIIFKRLHSRGFVRRVCTDGSGAKHVAACIEHAFSGLLDWLSRYSTTPSSASHSLRSGSVTPRPSRQDFCLTPRWQPLRKIFRQTFLEHLTPSELALPSFWNVDFINEHCVQSGKNLFYITPLEVSSSTLTWNDIRRLPPFIDSDFPATAVPDESVWRYHPKLDPVNMDSLGSFITATFAESANESSMLPPPSSLSKSAPSSTKGSHESASTPRPTFSAPVSTNNSFQSSHGRGSTPRLTATATTVTATATTATTATITATSPSSYLSSASATAADGGDINVDGPLQQHTTAALNSLTPPGFPETKPTKSSSLASSRSASLRSRSSRHSEHQSHRPHRVSRHSSSSSLVGGESLSLVADTVRGDDDGDKVVEITAEEAARGRRGTSRPRRGRQGQQARRGDRREEQRKVHEDSKPLTRARGRQMKEEEQLRRETQSDEPRLDEPATGHADDEEAVQEKETDIDTDTEEARKKAREKKKETKKEKESGKEKEREKGKGEEREREREKGNGKDREKSKKKEIEKNTEEEREKDNKALLVKLRFPRQQRPRRQQYGPPLPVIPEPHSTTDDGGYASG